MRSFVVRFYTKHDIDLLPLYYRNVNVPDTIHQVLVAFVEGEELILSFLIQQRKIFYQNPA